MCTRVSNIYIYIYFIFVRTSMYVFMYITRRPQARQLNFLKNLTASLDKGRFWNVNRLISFNFCINSILI